MNRIDELFAGGKKNLLNIFCTAGYPQIDSMGEWMLALQKHGADMIEIGMPYSDPIADGPVIQQSNMNALHNGMNMELLFKQLNQVKELIHIPVILMGYLNPVLQYGVEKFCKDAKDAGVNGVILPDLPMYEFEKYYQAEFKKKELHFIFLITPETSVERIKKIDKLTGGFIYAVASSATTGHSIDKKMEEGYFKKLLKMKLTKPLLGGFGIDDHKSFQKVCKYTRGAIIGSAFIKTLKNSKDLDRDTAIFIRHIRPENE